MKTKTLIACLVMSLLSAAAARNASAAAESPASPVHRSEGGRFDIDVLRLSPRAAVFYGGPWSNAIVAIASQKGIVVVDAPFCKMFSQGFRDAVRKEFKRDDFACLINTHEDICHIGGNEAFADVPIVGHESLRGKMLKWAADPKWAGNCRKMGEANLAAKREQFVKLPTRSVEDPEFVQYEQCWKLILADYSTNFVLVPPTITFDRDMTLYSGDITARLAYYGYAHGGADIIVSVPEENLVMTGGLFYAPHLPMLNRGAGQAIPQIVNNWFAVMHQILNEANDQTRFIPGHDCEIMTKEQCAQQVAYLEKLWAGLLRLKSDGKTLAQARAALPLEDFPEVAKLANVKNLGTPWERRDIHGQNIDLLWAVAGK
jgi:glyoxylase-like metal-dependent hydrolase (beta-lactamase superfamily II)